MKRHTAGACDAPRKRRKTAPEGRLPQLPGDVVGRIVRHLGVRGLGRAAQVCRTWRDAVDANGAELWRAHCQRIGAHTPAGDVRQLAQERQEAADRGDSRAAAGARRRLAQVYRLAYFTKRHSVCAHCLRGEARDYPLYGVRLCVDCMRREPYAWIRRSTAARHFRLGKALAPDAARPLASMPIVGRAFGRKRDGPLYRFADVLRLSRAAFGEAFTNQRANVVRALFRIRPMQGEHFKDI